MLLDGPRGKPKRKHTLLLLGGEAATGADGINALGGGGHMKALESGFSQYDSTRGQVVSGINNVQTMHSRLKRAVPEIDL